MGLFGKKEKKHCPICDSEMTFLNSVLIANDDLICSDCEKMLRGQYAIEQYVKTGFGGSERLKTSDPLRSLSIDDIRAFMAKKQQEQAEATAELGGEYANLLKADEVFSIAPKPLEVGIKRAKTLKNRCVVKGMVLAGEFAQGDAVTVRHGAAETRTTILELIPCGGVVDFETALRANSHKKPAPVNTNAWLILDLEGMAAAIGDMIVE